MQSSFQKYSVVFMALVVALFARLFIVSVYKVPTESMSPTFLPGDFIFASQISYGLKFPWSESTWFKSSPKKGDLIIFSFKNKPSVSYLKRVAGIEGDQVMTAGGKQTVGAGQVYVLSDNTQILEDSRDLGLVSIDQIESQARLIWFSLSPDSEIRWKRMMTHFN